MDSCTTHSVYLNAHFGFANSGYLPANNSSSTQFKTFFTFCCTLPNVQLCLIYATHYCHQQFFLSPLRSQLTAGTEQSTLCSLNPGTGHHTLLDFKLTVAWRKWFYISYYSATWKWYMPTRQGSWKMLQPSAGRDRRHRVCLYTSPQTHYHAVSFHHEHCLTSLRCG